MASVDALVESTAALRVTKHAWPQPPPSFAPPEAPLPSPQITSVELVNRLHAHLTPEPSPMGTPLRTSPNKLVDVLISDERAYLRELQTLQTICSEDLLATGGDVALGASIAELAELSNHLIQGIDTKTYFSDAQNEFLIAFSAKVADPYRRFYEVFQLGLARSIEPSSATATRLDDLLRGLQQQGNLSEGLDWLMRRPLSRVKAYMSLYKRLLHSSDDATDLFLVYEAMHELLVEAREVLSASKKRLDGNGSRAVGRGIADPLHINRNGSRTVSAESTSTQASANSRISSHDELVAIQNSLDTSQTRDIFSHALIPHEVDLIPKAGAPDRCLISRASFQLQIGRDDAAQSIDTLVELILLTDLLLITKPSFTQPQLLFAPLDREVFHVSSSSTNDKVLELDIVGRETLTITAGSRDARNHWLELLLACENHELEVAVTTTTATVVAIPPASIAKLISHKTPGGFGLSAPPRAGPPTPPPFSPMGYPLTAPLRVIREDSQLSIGGHSELSTRTPEANDHQPFVFDPEDEQTPRAGYKPNPLDNNERAPAVPVKPHLLTVDTAQVAPSTEEPGSATPRATAFPLLPTRAPPATPSTTAAPLLQRAQTEIGPMQLSLMPPRLTARSKSAGGEEVKSSADIQPEDLDFTKDQEFDASVLDLPELPPFNFGDGVERPSSMALNFSPGTLTSFGIPLRKIAPPAPMILPDGTSASSRNSSPQKGTLAERRTGGTLALQPAAPLIKLDAATDSPARSVKLEQMAECFTWTQGTWVPMLMDNVDDEGRVKTVRSSRITIYSFTADLPAGVDVDSSEGKKALATKPTYVDVFDTKDAKTMNTFCVSAQTSIIRDDACDVSAGFDVGQDKVYFLFRCVSPEKTDTFLRILTNARDHAPSTAPDSNDAYGAMPITPLAFDDAMSGALAVDNLKIKLYRFDFGKWVNRGSARLTVRYIPNTLQRRLVLIGKTKKGERILLVDTLVGAGDQGVCAAISKTGISLKTRTEMLMMQFKTDKERTRILAVLVDQHAQRIQRQHDAQLQAQRQQDILRLQQQYSTATNHTTIASENEHVQIM